ncbi:GAF and ANTAR domain-containing protein [Kribbella sp. NBC_00709]|uniref:GAF and ANTAR domain-containing protein n=1 Tax=Kribbella sp. NBC_00709 TaxID=2975972 RepID=UPI002E2B4806|nr:GAF and ANTAR domain-containing protein [Kribbella sp. NBC_00709]
MHDAGGVEETVQAVVEFALHAVGCQYAGVALYAKGGNPEVPAATDPTVAGIFRFQMDGDAGPLVECLRSQATVVVPDTTSELRWPEWAKKVQQLGVHSVLDVPLRTAAGTVGVLGLYSVDPEAFGPDAEAIAHILARHASVAVATARREQNLNLAVDARKLVGQAMGILMERYGLDSDRAFQVLKRYSQQTNTKLHDVARQLIDTRTLPRS